MFPTDKPIAGKVIAASPDLLDPNFSQSLIFLAEHDENGALGLILNRPTGKTLGEMVSQEHLIPALEQVPLYLGGPVSPSSIIIAIFEPGFHQDQLFCHLTTKLDELGSSVQNAGKWVRAFAGYSGWGSGQLEGELRENSWKICPPSPALFNEKFVANIWTAFVSGDERWRSLVDHLPDDPSLN